MIRVIRKVAKAKRVTRSVILRDARVTKRVRWQKRYEGMEVEDVESHARAPKRPLCCVSSCMCFGMDILITDWLALSQ